MDNNPGPSTSTQNPSTSTAEHTSNDNITTIGTVRQRQIRTSIPCGMKFFNNPRESKHLLILDIDKTIYDSNVPGSTDEKFAIRPHLREFLNTVHQYYDIIIWSSTAMHTIEQKMAQIFRHLNRDYKILCFVNAEALVLVKLPNNGFVKTKPLRYIWRQFPQYNEKNTIICDDTPTNFVLNEKNGITVEPYRYTCFNTDTELIKLMAYLEHLAKNSENFAAEDHSSWRSFVPEEKTSRGLRLHK